MLLLLILLLAGCGQAASESGKAEADNDLKELRGVWLTNVDSEVLGSRERIAEAMQFLADHHFNAVFPVVWNGGYTLYPSAVMADYFGQAYAIDPQYEGWDPLQAVVEEAHKREIAVIPWFEFGFAASYEQDGGHILNAYPRWAAVDAEGTLLEKNGFEWMNGYQPVVRDFMLALILEVAKNYDVDGIQGDDRLPAQPVEGGYAAYTDSLYRVQHEGQAPPQNPRAPQFMRWRADRLSTFAGRVYDAVKAVDSTLQVSWAPSIYPWSYEEYLQDWPAWVEAGHYDLLHPQVYRYDLADYRETLAAQRPKALGLDPAVREALYPGVLISVGDYLITPGFLLNVVEANRAAGFDGEVFFFYEGLAANGGALADTLLATFYEAPARLPF